MVLTVVYAHISVIIMVDFDSEVNLIPVKFLRLKFMFRDSFYNKAHNFEPVRKAGSNIWTIKHDQTSIISK